ncbi:MAG: efflux RND transporter permease subunit [Woeseiaceae bacterium]
MQGPGVTDQKGIIAWFAANHVAANLLMLLIIVAGLMSGFAIRKETQPDFELNTIQVRVPYLGAAPQEVEEGVVIKVEEAIQDLEGIKRIRSTAFEGTGVVTIEVELDADINEVMSDVKTRVDAISTFPALTEKPVIFREENQQHVVFVAIHGDMDDFTRKTIAQDVRDELMQLPLVNQVQYLGDRPYEISIEVSEHTLREYGLTMSEISQAVRDSSVDMPGGSIRSDGGDILLRTEGQVYTGAGFGQLVLRTFADGTRLTLADIATIDDGFVETEGFGRFDGHPTATLRVLAGGQQNELETAEAVRSYIAKKEKTLPDGIEMDTWIDLSYYLEGRLRMMTKNMWQGALLVFILLSLFLRMKVAFWVIVGLPITFLGALWLMPLWPVTINMISLFGFIVVLGIVVDDAIIIGESIHTTIREDVVMACLFFSLVESKLILPAHLAQASLPRVDEDDLFDPQRQVGFGERIPRAFLKLQRRFQHGLQRLISGIYRPMLERAVDNRGLTVAIFVALLILTFGLISGGIARVVLFPDVPGDFIQVNLQMQTGTPSEARNRAIERLEQSIFDLDKEFRNEHDDEQVLVRHVGVFTQGDTGAFMFVELPVEENRLVEGSEVTEMWRDRAGEIPGVKMLTFSSQGHIGGDASISFRLSGGNYDALQKAAAELEVALAEYDGVFDIRNSANVGGNEIRLAIKPAAEALGLTMASLGRQVRQAFYGEEAQRIQRGKDELRVMVRYPLEERKSVADLQNMRIRTPAGDEVPFESVADISYGTSYSSISRLDRERTITVSADVDPELVQPQEITSSIANDFIPDLLAKYPGISFGLEGASEEQLEFVQDLTIAAVAALFLIYALIAIPLHSYSQPLLIMSVIPFGIVGAVVGHILMDTAVSMFSMFGLIALAGVVVNDSLIMVDFINKARLEGVNLRQAVIESGTRRFRAIVLTSLTTAAGLLPILTEDSLQAKFVIPTAISLSFGIMFATIITLFLVPSLYMLQEDASGRWRALRAWVSGGQPRSSRPGREPLS